MLLQKEKIGNPAKYKNYAFISYSHANARWANKIHSQLEQYRLPAHLRKKYRDTPARAYPISRDRTNLYGSKVWSAITKELDESQYLIVVCSPESARSTWVNEEVQYFIDTGREDKILPVIIGGVPLSSDPKTECFPPALRNMADAPLGTDVHKQGWRNTKLNLIASLLNIDFEELLRRDNHRRVRNGVILGACGALLGVVLGYQIWYNTEHSKYYNVCTWQYELPVGYYELTQKERAGMYASYRITTLRNKVVRLEYVNSAGIAVDERLTLSGTFHSYPIQEFLYNDQGELDSVILRDTTGMETGRKNITLNKTTRKGIVEFRSSANPLKVQALSADLLKSGSNINSEITRLYNTYNEDGHLTKSLYQRSSLGEPACDSNGVYGMEYEYNDQGLISLSGYLDENGERFNCKYGYAYGEIFYDQKGNYVYNAIYNVDGTQVECENGYSAQRLEYDASGNLVSELFLGKNSQPTYCKAGYAQSVLTYSVQGYWISTKHYDAEGKPTYSDEGIHEIEYTHDDSGRIICCAYYDTDGNPVYSPKLSAASIRGAYDENGRVIEQRNYDTQGGPCCDRDTGAYGYRYTYDENGYRIRVDYLNADGEPTTSKYGYATWCSPRNENGQVIRDEYRDEEGNLTRSNENFAVKEFEYDTFGNIIEQRFYDEHSDPCYSTYGYAIIQRTYENGNLISERFYDTEGKPTLTDDYYFEAKWEYDDVGNCTKASYFDTDGNLIRNASGYATIEIQYDVYGNRLSESYYTADGEPAYIRGAHEYRFSYDSRGNQIAGEQDGSYPSSLAYVFVEVDYDVYGNVIEKRFYDENHTPTTADRYPAQLKQEYDEQGNLTRREYVYLLGEQTSSIIECMTYDERSNRILEQSFRQKAGEEAECLYQTSYTYDDSGNCVRTDHLDGDGKLSAQEEGYASEVKGYTPQGNIAWVEYYDDCGNPYLYASQAFRFEYSYDTMGNQIEVRRYDENGELRKESSGLEAITRYEYDVHRKRTYESRFNENDQPYGTTADRVSSIKYVLDGAGYKVERYCYDKSGELLRDERFAVYVDDVFEGYSGYEMGVQEGQFVVQLGHWNYFEAYDYSSQSVLKAECSRTNNKEKTLILCDWLDDDTFFFHSLQMPEGTIGIQMGSYPENTQVLERMEQAYWEWVESDTENQ